MDGKPTYADLEKKIAALNAELAAQKTVAAQYRNLVDSTDDSLYLVDADARYLFMNSNHARRLNLPPAGISGLPYADLHTPEQTEAFAAKIREVFATGASLSDEHHSLRDNQYFLRTFSPVRDAADPGKVAAVSVVSKNVTSRRWAVEALRASEEKYRQLIEYSGEAIFILTGGKIRFANSQTEKMLGYPLDDLKLISFINLVISEDREMVFDRQKALLHGDVSAGINTFRIVNKEGATTWVAQNSAAITWDNSPATLNYMRDITRQKKTEARLLQAQKMESIGTLAGGIAHDFNNLLMGIQGHASLALLKLDRTDPSYDHFKTIESLVISGAGLTRQLLGFARSGKYEVRQADVNALVEKTLQTLGRTSREIRIHRRLADHLWPSDIDQGQIEQALLNLLINARQAMPGGGDLYVETKNTLSDENRFQPLGGRSDRYIRISITDTGVGMDEKTRERIFEPFFTTKAMGRGTGLGLASVYGIIKNHNGFINVYSEKGQGSTFHVYLPASTRPDKDWDRPAELPEQVSPGTETILLVDDEAMILDVAGAILKTLGYTVIAARTGADALAIYRSRQAAIDLVILDMVMPDMNGEEVFSELKLLDPQVRVLLASGYSLNAQAERILDRGCSGFIQKPFTSADISCQVRAILGSPGEHPRRESAQIPLPLFDKP